MLRLMPAWLHRVRIFAPLGQPSLIRLGAIGELADIDDGATLCREDDPADRLYVPLDGMVTPSAHAADGRSAVLEVVRPIRHLVLATVLAGLPYVVSAMTITPGGRCYATIQGWQVLGCARRHGSRTFRLYLLPLARTTRPQQPPVASADGQAAPRRPNRLSA